MPPSYDYCLQLIDSNYSNRRNEACLILTKSLRADCARSDFELGNQILFKDGVHHRQVAK